MIKKLLIVFGTRPEAIKMVPLVKSFQRYANIFDIKVCVTAQHREMLDQVLEIFQIKPDFDLNIMKSGQDLYDITANVLVGMRGVLRASQPDLVFVHGDTTTSFVTSLACFYEKIKVAHVEAGLRTYDMSSPWPEEANRQLTCKLAHFHFAPTKKAQENLLLEQISEKTILVTGNTVIDTLFMVHDQIANNLDLQKQLQTELKNKGYSFNNDRKIILVTGHRRENFGQGFIHICEALKVLACNNPTVDIVYPVHLNPYVQKPVKDILSKIANIFLIEPLSYLPFVYLMSKSYLIITDSGGVQEEAPSLGKPVLVMRDTTERPEAVDAGTVRLVGTNKEKIVQEAQTLLDNHNAYNTMAQASNPYGDGKACERIIEFIRGLQ